MYELIHKPTFTNQLLGLQPKFMGQVLEKVESLREDPAPHGNVKKKLHGYRGNVYRLRSGDFRIVYSFGPGWVTLLGVDDRKDVYRGDRLVAEPPSMDLTTLSDADLTLEPVNVASFAPEAPVPTADDLLPFTVDSSLLARLRIPREHHDAFLGCRTLEDLLSAPVPERYRELVFDLVASPDFDEVLEQPSLQTGEVADLLRFAEGELVGFLLRLDPEQEHLVDWAVDGTGPTLVKGGPGTGKSTIALYRVRSMIDSLRRHGNPEPRVLFTTYTNALVAGSRQLLARVLGDDLRLVDVRTADSVAAGLLEDHPDGHVSIADRATLRSMLDEAIGETARARTPVQRRLMVGALDAIERDYLLDELEGLIEGREIASLDEYLTAPRSGRLLPLHRMQRRAVWQVSESLTAELARRRMTTWSRRRRRAAEMARAGLGPRYDAVVVDEAQDLEPSALRMLVALCPDPSRFFLTADANQSIYGGSFRWQDVHEDLRFRGRTSLLRRNYRSTEQIGIAAQSYLREGRLDPDATEDVLYVLSGPLPAVRWVAGRDSEADLLKRFVLGASREFHIGLGACAILVPTDAAGQEVAGRLAGRGIDARFMPGRELDLESPVVKVITLKSAKGLEFPVVGVAGFNDGQMQTSRLGSAREEARELLEQERRTLFVAYTRAMRALLVVLPTGQQSPLFSGFDEPYWNLAPA